MKMPRDILGKQLIKTLKVFGYEAVRQTGSHIMITSDLKGEYHFGNP